MADHKNHLSRAYGLDSQDATNAFYTDWAATYDAEVIANGYKTPERLAAALANHVLLEAPILDIGCGTGYSGHHLAKAGFQNIDGTDPNAEMLAIAEQRQVYRKTWLTDLSDAFPFKVGTYHVITAIGVIGTGAGPASLIEDIANRLTSGGILSFSFNDHALEDAEFTTARDAILTSGKMNELYRDYGPHLTGKDLGSDIYIFERT